MRTMNTFVFASVAAAALAVMSVPGASPARADEIVTASQVVHLRGLDLRAPRDRLVVRHRLMVAASKVCTDGGATDLNDGAYLDCRKAAFKTAWSQAETLMASAKGGSLLAANASPAR